jgi:anaerobic carbon-monoxide dehydrogenase iron sulfur subunit
MFKSFIVDPSKCTGCHRCELWCSFKNHNVINPFLSRIKIICKRNPPMDLPVVCSQCGICISACPVKAIKVDKKTGAVIIDKEICNCCGHCLKVCPYGMISIDLSNKVAMKCDLCGGKPECVEHCNTGAIRYITLDKIADSRRELYTRMIAKIITQEN